MDKEMSRKTYAALFLFVHIIRSAETGFNSNYAIETNDYPKSSCHELSSVKSMIRCLATCVATMDEIVMISHDDSTSTCMCCNDVTGSDITGSNWKSYVPRICK